ncbi:MAG: TonB family protein [Gilvibacter sp.]
MRILFALLFVSICSSAVAQETWGDVDKNKVTMQELPPVWPGCESGTNAQELSKCFNQKLAQHIASNFKYPAAEYNANIEGRVIVDFVINEAGRVEIKSVSGGNEALQNEAKRNILEMPELKPGMLAGKPRVISYKVPFTFKTGRN